MTTAGKYPNRDRRGAASNRDHKGAARDQYRDRQGAASEPRPSGSGPPCIALIGLRGCGKSSVGRELADLLGGVCVDTDEFVTEQAGKSIAAIFAEEGEAGFRRRERDAVAQVSKTASTVISVGGGAILDERNVEALRRVATLVWLTAPADVLYRRISSDPATAGSRPPLTPLVRDPLVRDSNLAPAGRTAHAEIEHLLAERSPYYQRAAELIIDTTDRSPRQIAEAIAAKLTRTPSK